MHKLKAFVVRQVADALSDYVEGVTPEGVTASLGTDTGSLDLSARINPAVLRPLGLELINSAVDLHVSIPWRHLESQPTEIEVKGLKLEVSLLPPGSAAKCDSPDPDKVEKLRAAKEAKVQKLEAAQRDQGESTAPGRIARASHAILRLLQASITNIDVQLNRAETAEPPVALEVQSVQLRSVGADWVSGPEQDSGDLRKVFLLRGLRMQEQTVDRPPIIGPLALEACLHHAPSEQMVHLKLGTQGDAAAELRPEYARLGRRVLASIMAAAAQGAAKPLTLDEEAGRNYAKLFTRKLLREPFDEDQFRKIEDIAPPEWIAAWRCHVHKLRAQSAASSEERQAAQSRPRRSTIMQWFKTSAAEEQLTSLAEFVQAESAETLLDDAITAGLVPEVALPSRIKVDLSIPRVGMSCIGSESKIGLDAQGAVVSVDISAKVPAVCQTTTYLWHVSARARLASLTMRLDDQPLVELVQSRAGNRAQTAHASRRPSWEEAAEEFDCAVDVRLDGSQRDALVSGSPPFDAQLMSKMEPVVIHLASWRIHGALATIVDIATPLLEPSREVGPQCAPSQPQGDHALPPIGTSGSSLQPQEEPDSFNDESFATASGMKEATLKVDVSIEAPILSWEVPQSGTRLQVRLGHLCARTGGVGSAIPNWTWKQLPAAEPVSLAAFACVCELKDTSAVLVGSDGRQRSVYQHPELKLRVGQDPGITTFVQVATMEVGVRLDQEFAKFLGQIRMGLDYAIAPLARLGTSGSMASEEAAVPADLQQGAPMSLAGTAVPAERETRAVAAKQSAPGLRVDLTFGQFKLAWGGERVPVVAASFGCTTVKVSQKAEHLTVQASLTQINLKSLDADLLDCSRGLTMAVEHTPSEARVEVVLTPVVAQWVAAPTKAALAAAADAAQSFADGKEFAGKELPPSDDGSALSLHLWNVYVKERAERLGEGAQTYVQHELGQLGLAEEDAAQEAPSSSQVCYLKITCEEVSASVVPDERRTGVRPATLIAFNTRGEVAWQPLGLKCTASLGSVSLDVGSRRILTPKKAQGTLLDVTASVGKGKAPTVDVAWAQVVAVYLQRDLESLMELVNVDVMETLAILTPSMADDAAPSTPVIGVTATSSAGAASTARVGTGGGGAAMARLQYKLCMRAPLVFMPVPPPGGAEATACLSPKAGEQEFKPDRSQDFLVVDFGHLEVIQGEAASTVQLTLTEARMLTGSENQPWKQILHPIGVGMKLTFGSGSVDVKMRSPLSELDRQHMRLTRAQLTLVLNIVATFMSPGSAPAEQRAPSMSSPSLTSTSRKSLADVPAPSKDISFAWAWQGPLALDVSFTDEAPLAKLELREGAIDFRSGAKGQVTDIRFRALEVHDARSMARNADKVALRCTPEDSGSFGLRVVMQTPPAGTGGRNKIEVDLARPTLLVLPQWFMDLSTWSLSSYQHSALARAGAQPSQSQADVQPAAEQLIEVRVPAAAARAPLRWGQAGEFFELAADVSLHLTQRGSTTCFDQVTLTGGRLSRVTQSVQLARLCEGFEFAGKGKFEMSEDQVRNQREGNFLLETLQIKRFSIGLSVTEAASFGGMIGEIAQMDAQSAEPAEELRSRDPLALIMQNRFALVFSHVEVCGIDLQLLEQSEGGWARPAMEMQISGQKLALAVQTAAGEPPKGFVKAEGVTLAARSFNERIGHWEPILAPSRWSLAGQARAESKPRTFKLMEHEDEQLPPKYGEGSIIRAWYGDPSCVWARERGRDVTEAVKQLLKAGKTIRPSNKFFGDPVAGVVKGLFVELRQEAVLKTQVDCGPLQLVVTVPFVNLVNRLLPSAQDREDTTEPPDDQRRIHGGMLLGLNLSGAACTVCLKEGDGAAAMAVRLDPSEAPLPLDALLTGWDGAKGKGHWPHLLLQSSLAKKAVTISLEAVGSQVCSATVGDLLIQVLMPRPPQRLLLITSTLSVRNCSPFCAEVRFLSFGQAAISAAAMPRCTKISNLKEPRQIRDITVQKAKSTNNCLAVVPAAARKVRGQIKLDIVRATALGKPAYRPGDHVKSFLQIGSDLKIYVEVELIGGGESRKTDIIQASRSRAEINQSVDHRFPEGTTMDSLRGREIAIRVFNKVGIRGAIRGDPLIGECKVRLGSAELRGEAQRLTLHLRRGGENQGQLEVVLQIFFREIPDSSVASGVSIASANRPILWTPSELGNSELKSMCEKLGVSTQGMEREDILQALEVNQEGRHKSSSSSSDQPVGEQTVFRVEPGHIFAAPLEVVCSMSQVQFRPAAVGGASFAWGQAFSVSQLDSGATCFAGPADHASDLPGCHLHLTARTFGTKRQGCEVRIESPFSIANGCPCEVHCALGYPDSYREFGWGSDECDAEADVVVADGCGGEWRVEPGKRVDIFPLKLARQSPSYLTWFVGRSRRDKVVQWTEADSLRVQRDGRKVTWLFRKQEGFREFATKAGNPFIVCPEQEIPFLDARSEGLLLRIALLEQHSGETTSWSNPLPVVVPTDVVAHMEFKVSWRRQQVLVRAVRKSGRRVVLYVSTWFVDSTGLGIGISYAPDGPRIPQFGNNIALLGDELKDDNPQVHLSLPGRETVAAAVPILGGSSRVQMSALHECALITEPIAVTVTFGVMCKLMSLIPGLMVFNQMEDCDIGFQQVDCPDVTWLKPGGSSQLYWVRADKKKRVQVAVRPPQVPGGSWAPPPSFSAPVVISEAGVGAFPMAFPEPRSLRFACLQVDQSGELFSLTMLGAAHCHQLENRHPCLTLRAYFETEEGGTYTDVPFGARAPLAVRTFSDGARLRDRLRLELRDTERPVRQHNMTIDLSRAALHRVSERTCRRPKDDVALMTTVCDVPSSWVNVEIRSRVAIVTVSPVIAAGSADEVSWGFELEVNVESLGLSLIGEKPHGEVFAVLLQRLSLKSDQTATGRQASQFQVQGLHVDLMRPKPVVVLSSVRSEGPFLRLEAIREDIFARDMTFTKIILQLSTLEVSADDTLIREARHYMEVAAPRAIGLDFNMVLARAGVPYNLSCGGPPRPSSKFVLHDVFVGRVKFVVFCQLRIDILPDWLASLISILSGFSDQMEIDGAVMALQEQQLFGSNEGSGCAGCGGQGSAASPPSRAFEGNTSAVFEHVQQRYTKLYLKALLSLVNNSNLILGGVFTRHLWNPKNRSRHRPLRHPLNLLEGAVSLADEDLHTFLGEESSLSFLAPRLEQPNSRQQLLSV